MSKVLFCLILLLSFSAFAEAQEQTVVGALITTVFDFAGFELKNPISFCTLEQQITGFFTGCEKNPLIADSK